MSSYKSTSFVLLSAVAIAFVSISLVKIATGTHIVEMHYLYAVDYAVDEKLVGASHNIFVGKITEISGNKDRGNGPETQYRAEVVSNIKGDLHGSVTVNQQGGYSDGKLYIAAESNNPDDYLLRVGDTYLFSTRYNDTEDWYTLNTYANAIKKISSDRNASPQFLNSLAENDERVKELVNAYPNEVLLESDVKNLTTYNSFSDTPGKRGELDIAAKRNDGKAQVDDLRENVEGI